MQKNKTSKLIKVVGSVLLAAMLSYLVTRYVSLIDHLETRTVDIRQAGFGPQLPQDKRIVVVGLDEQTLSKFPYRSPIDRAFLADLLLTIESKGAKAIYLDVLLDQPTEAYKDEKLFQVIRELKIPLVIGYTNSKEILAEDQQYFLDKFVPSKFRGLVNLATDSYDGTVRWINPGVNDGPGGISVPYALLKAISHPLPDIDFTGPSSDWLSIVWRRPSVEGSAPYAVYPAHTLAVLPDDWIKSKVVMVGAIVSLTDRHRTPFAIYKNNAMGMMSGVEILTHQVSQLLDNKVLPEIELTEILLLNTLAATLGWLLAIWRKSLVLTILATVSIICAYWYFALVNYAIGWPLIPLIGPTLSILISLFLNDFVLGKDERDRRKFIQTAFSKYLAPNVVKKLVEHPESLRIAGEKRELSFIFTDIAGFTTLSEKLPPEVLTKLLNQYLEGMCAQIQKHQGTVDKFIGDSVMCFFNSPLDQPDHADRALACAHDLDHFCESFRKKLLTQRIELGSTRIGVHSGSAVVGNFGSLSRMEFTALGDTVNAASRTEGVNKYFGTRMCVTEATLKLSTGLNFFFRPIGNIVLKGKKNPIGLYQPVDEEFFNSELYNAYMAAYALLEAGDSRVKKVFADLFDLYGEDELFAFHHNRLQHGASNAVILMEEK
jgi:class 3 adenylate cyclase/CHASE2 domain-containing sensor protein